MTTAGISFENYKKLGAVTVTVPKDRSEVEFALFSESSDEPIWCITLKDLQSSEFMQKARIGLDALPKGSKLQAYARSFALRDTDAAWVITDSIEPTETTETTETTEPAEPAEPIDPQEYFEHGVYGYLEPLYKKVGIHVTHVLATVAIDLIAGRDHTGWFRRNMCFNGTYLRSKSDMAGRLPTGIKQLHEWDPRNLHWR